MNVFSYYLLWVCVASSPCTDWRVEGGYDSCLLMAQMVQKHSPGVGTHCEQVVVRR